MTDAVTLPVQVSSATKIKYVIVLLLVSAPVWACVLFYALSISRGVAPVVEYGAPITYFGFTMISAAALWLTVKPRRIDIDANTVTVTPLTAMGSVAGVPQSRPLSDFDSLDVKKVSGGKGGTVFFLVLHSRDGKSDVKFDAPPKTRAKDYAQQLGAALKLKVNADA